MHGRVGNFVFGFLFILAGIGYAGNVLNLWNFTLFFNGFWTLFLIIPAVLDIIKRGFRPGNAIVFAVGVVFLLKSQDFFGIYMLNRLVWPAALVLIGIFLIFSRKSKPYQFISTEYQSEISAVFSGKDVKVDQKLSDMRIEAVFGGVNLDLRSATLDSDVNIYIESIFGGANVYVPENVEIIVSDSSVFGGVTNKSAPVFTVGAKKIYISAKCVFGGIEIK